MKSTRRKTLRNKAEENKGAESLPQEMHVLGRSSRVKMDEDGKNPEYHPRYPHLSPNYYRGNACKDRLIPVPCKVRS